MDDYERRVQAEIDRLSGPEFPKSRRAREQRAATIRAVAEAAVAKKPLTGERGALGPQRAAGVVGESAFYEKLHWHKHPLVQQVIDSVAAIYRERLTAEQEAARQAKSVWLFNKEFEAAEALFDKAHELLKLPHLVKKVKRPKMGQDGKAAEETVTIDPANGPVFNAAVSMVRAASDLGRRSLGLPTDTTRSELTGAAGGPVVHEHKGQTHGEPEHLAVVLATLVSAGAIQLPGAGDGDAAEDDALHRGNADA